MGALKLFSHPVRMSIVPPGWGRPDGPPYPSEMTVRDDCVKSNRPFIQGETQ